SHSFTKTMENGNNKLKESENQPTDKFYLVHLIFLLFGIMHLLPISFFVTANDYWMHKFRNTSLETIDPNDRSKLQSNFASGSIIAQSIPTIICMILSTIFGYRIKARRRVIISLFVLTSSFVLSTGFIKINTDSWQTWFFVMTMAILAVMNGILALFQTLNGPWLSGIAIIRMIVFVPLFIFCNALPRSHLPVLFSHDWQYIVILASFFISSGYLFNIAFLNITK
ncbi:hypothetical protein NQ314_012740, partial [Rhamnusium bicolor]